MQCLEAAISWGASWCSQLEDPHMASPWDVNLVTTWWLSSKGKKEREMGVRQKPCSPLWQTSWVTKHLLLSRAVTKVQPPSRGGNGNPISGREACSCHTVDMWSGTYVGMTVSRKNTIFHGAWGWGLGISRKYGDWQTLGLQYYFVTFSLNVWLPSMRVYVAPKK